MPTVSTVSLDGPKGSPDSERNVNASKIGALSRALCRVWGKLRLASLAEALAERAPAALGLVAVHTPGALLAPAARVVWGKATAEALRAPTLPSLSSAARRALAAEHGFSPPDAPAAAAATIAGLTRSLDRASETLLNARPLRDFA